VAIAAYEDLDMGPAFSDAPDDMGEDPCDLFAGRHLAGPQERGDRPARGCFEDHDRLEASHAGMGVEHRELLGAVHRIVSLVDVEHDTLRGRAKAVAKQVYEPEPDTHQLAPAASVLEP